jgi:hypothetical protein
MMISGKFVVSVPVGMGVGTIKSGVVGVFVGVLERSLSGEGVVVVVGDVSGVTLETGNGAIETEGCGVTEAVGEGVGVRQGPGVLRLRYCGHSLSLIFIWRRPPGRLSQIVKVCVPSLLFCWGFWFGFGGDVGLGVDVETGDGELDVGEDTITEEVAVGVTDGEGVFVGTGAIDGEGDAATVGDDSDVIVGELVTDGVGVGRGFGVGVLVCRVWGHWYTPFICGAGTRSSGLLMCGCAALSLALANVSCMYVPAPVA